MKILITGANGFIGSELVNFLSENTNYELILITRHKNNIDTKNKKGAIEL